MGAGLSSSGGDRLGDFVRALDALAPADEETRSAIALAFGLSLRSTSGVHETSLPALRWLPETGMGLVPEPMVAGEEKDADEQPVTPLPALGPDENAGAVLDSELTPAGRVAGERPEWLIEAKVLDEPLRAERPTQVPDPLFLPRWAPGILAISLATTAPDGPVDSERLVEMMASRQTMRQLPRRPRPTLRGGAQVLVDLSESMQPFLADEVGLLDSIERVVGGDSLAILRFAGCPSRGAGPGVRKTWARYEPPPTPRPVAVITDFGIGAPVLSRDASSVLEWRVFASEVRRAGCPLIGLVPFGPERIPSALRRDFRHIVWDRRTTAGSAARAIRTATRR
jgi:hypothetical protein